MNDLIVFDARAILEQTCGKRDVKIRWAFVDNQKWICAIDIARALNYKTNKGEQVTRLVDDKKNVRKFHFVIDELKQQGKPDMNFVNDSGVMDIIVKSQSEVAKNAWRQLRDAIVKILETPNKAQATTDNNTLALPAPLATNVLPDFTFLLSDRRRHHEITNEEIKNYGDNGIAAINGIYSAGLISQKLYEIALYGETRDGNKIKIFDKNDALDLWGLCAYMSAFIMFPDANGNLEKTSSDYKGFEYRDDIFGEYVNFMCGGVTWTDVKKKGEWQGGFRAMHGYVGSKHDFCGVRNFNMSHRDAERTSEPTKFEKFLAAGWDLHSTVHPINHRDVIFEKIRLRKISDYR